VQLTAATTSFQIPTADTSFTIFKSHFTIRPLQRTVVFLGKPNSVTMTTCVHFRADDSLWHEDRMKQDYVSTCRSRPVRRPKQVTQRQASARARSAPLSGAKPYLVLQMIKTSPAFYGSLWFIILFTGARHRSLIQTRIKSTR
jgi:hypothetical protein